MSDINGNPEPYSTTFVGTCVDCGKLLRDRQHGDRCSYCAGEPLTPADIREALRKGFGDTARLLHRLGFHEEARWHELRAKGGN